MTIHDLHARVSGPLEGAQRSRGPQGQPWRARPADRPAVNPHVDRILQRGLIATYGLASGAGVAATFYTPPTMEDTIGDTGANTWGLFLLFGGMVCLAGVLRRRGTPGDWFGEYVGLWLVIAASGAYALAALATLGTDPGRAAGALLLSVLTTLLIVRWFRVRDDRLKARIRDGASFTNPPRLTP